MQMSAEHPFSSGSLRREISLKSEAVLSKSQLPLAVASEEEDVDSHAEGLAGLCYLSWRLCRIFSGPVTLWGHALSSLSVLRGKLGYKH